MKIPNKSDTVVVSAISLARIVSEDSQRPDTALVERSKSSKDS